MRIVSLSLKNFRCFSSVDLDVESSVVLIHGPNGSGKTSIIEALHYGCYLRSFKTHLPKEMVQSQAGGFQADVQAEGFGVSLGLIGGLAGGSSFDTLHIHFSRNKKTVKLNAQPVGSYKELYDIYKVVTITEDDLLMIQGAPSLRRSFIDHVVFLIDPDYAPLLRKYRHILENRNALIASGKNDDESYELWTDQLLSVSSRIQKARVAALKSLESEALLLLAEVFGNQGMSLSIRYDYARPYEDIETIASTNDLLIRYPSIKGHEMMQRRSLIGSHLDDFSLIYQGKSCRTYASRGQQKLLVFLLKLAHIRLLRSNQSGLDQPGGAVLLVDDFLADFDEERAQALLPLMISLPTQLIITTPVEGPIKEKLKGCTIQSIDMSKLD